MRECTNCGKEIQPHYNARGWCMACYRRWDRAGRPASGPPEPKYNRDLEGHLEDYRFLTELGIKDPDLLAQRLGVSVHSVERYRKMESKTDRRAVSDSKSDGW